MSIERLFNHNAVVWRATVTRDSFGGTVETWSDLPAPVGTNGHNCTPHQNWAGAQQDHGPGEQQSAKRVWYLHKDFDVTEFDVVEITAGPEAPLLLNVGSVSKPAALARPGQPVNQIEINVEVRSDELEVES